MPSASVMENMQKCRNLSARTLAAKEDSKEEPHMAYSNGGTEVPIMYKQHHQQKKRPTEIEVPVEEAIL